MIVTSIEDPIISIFINNIEVMGVERLGIIKHIRKKLFTTIQI